MKLQLPLWKQNKNSLQKEEDNNIFADSDYHPISAVQRLPRYKLLIEDLIKHVSKDNDPEKTTVSSETWEVLTQLQEKITAFNNEINQKKKIHKLERFFGHEANDVIQAFMHVAVNMNETLIQNKQLAAEIIQLLKNEESSDESLSNILNKHKLTKDTSIKTANKIKKEFYLSQLNLNAKIKETLRESSTPIRAKTPNTITALNKAIEEKNFAQIDRYLKDLQITDDTLRQVIINSLKPATIYVKNIVKEIINSEEKFRSILGKWTEVAKKIEDPQISPVLTAYDTISQNNNFSNTDNYTKLLNDIKIDEAIQEISREMNETLDHKKDSFTTAILSHDELIIPFMKNNNNSLPTQEDNNIFIDGAYHPISAVQRLPRYKILFEDLIKHVSKDNDPEKAKVSPETWEILTKSLEKITAVNNDINKKKRIRELEQFFGHNEKDTIEAFMHVEVNMNEELIKNKQLAKKIIKSLKSGKSAKSLNKILNNNKLIQDTSIKTANKIKREFYLSQLNLNAKIKETLRESSTPIRAKSKTLNTITALNKAIEEKNFAQIDRYLKDLQITDDALKQVIINSLKPDPTIYVKNIVKEIINSEEKFRSILGKWTEVAKKIEDPQISPVLTAYDTISQNNKFSNTDKLNEKKIDEVIQEISKEMNETLDYKKDSFTTAILYHDELIIPFMENNNNSLPTQEDNDIFIDYAYHPISALQRLPRYQMLFEDLIKHVSKDNDPEKAKVSPETWEILTKSLEKIIAVNNDINKKKKIHELEQFFGHDEKDTIEAFMHVEVNMNEELIKNKQLAAEITQLLKNEESSDESLSNILNKYKLTKDTSTKTAKKIKTEFHLSQKKEKAATMIQKMERGRQAKAKLAALKLEQLEKELTTSTTELKTINQDIDKAKKEIAQLQNAKTDTTYPLPNIQNLTTQTTTALEKQQNLLSEISTRTDKLTTDVTTQNRLQKQVNEAQISIATMLTQDIPQIKKDHLSITRKNAQQQLSSLQNNLETLHNNLKDYRAQKLEGVIGWFKRKFSHKHSNEYKKIISSEATIMQALNTTKSYKKELQKADINISEIEDITQKIHKEAAKVPAEIESQTEVVPTTIKPR